MIPHGISVSSVIKILRGHGLEFSIGPLKNHLSTLKVIFAGASVPWICFSIVIPPQTEAQEVFPMMLLLCDNWATPALSHMLRTKVKCVSVAAWGMLCHATKGRMAPGREETRVSLRVELSSAVRDGEQVVSSCSLAAVGLWCGTSWKQSIILPLCRWCCVFENASTRVKLHPLASTVYAWRLYSVFIQVRCNEYARRCFASLFTFMQIHRLTFGARRCKLQCSRDSGSYFTFLIHSA